MTDTIDITPNAEAQQAIAALFVAQICADFTKARRKDATSILVTILDLAYVAGANGIDRETFLGAAFARVGGVRAAFNREGITS